MVPRHTQLGNAARPQARLGGEHQAHAASPARVSRSAFGPGARTRRAPPRVLAAQKPSVPCPPLLSTTPSALAAGSNATACT